MLKSHDGLSIAQFRIDGFTYNRLRPYPSWEDILPEAIRLWRIYVATVVPEGIARAAVRYVTALNCRLPAGGLVRTWRRHLVFLRATKLLWEAS